MKIDVQQSVPRSGLAVGLKVAQYPCEARYHEEWDRCKSDVVYWVEKYVRTYDPRREEGDRWVAFMLWDCQKEYLAWLRDRYADKEHCVVKKCRTMGASWLTLCDFMHSWLFERHAKLTLGSRKEDLVDDPANPDSLFEKLRKTLEGLPDWMKPPGFVKREHDQKLKLVNPWNGSVMTGEGGDNMGTGGRSTKYLIDEFAKVERSRQVQAAVQDNSNFIVYVSTPEGTANEFARMVMEGHHPVFNFSVFQDPTRNGWELWEDGELAESGNGADAPKGAVYPWIEKEKLKRDPVNFAQEVMGDLYASMQDAVFPSAWVMAAVNYPVKSSGDVVAGLDLGGGSRLSTVLTPRQGPKALGQMCTGGDSPTKKLADLLEECAQARTPEGHRIVQVAYDASGESGSDFAKVLQGKKFPFALVPVMGQAAPTKRVWPDGRRSDEKFANLRTEACWVLRERFRKTFEARNGMAEHPDCDLVSIPNDPELHDQLSRLQFDVSETGKIRVVSKVKLRAMGVKAVDKADSLIYAFFHEKMEFTVYDRFKRTA